MREIIVCPECKEIYKIDYPNSVVWDNGNLLCKCGFIINFKNSILETLYT